MFMKSLTQPKLRLTAHPPGHPSGRFFSDTNPSDNNDSFSPATPGHHFIALPQTVQMEEIINGLVYMFNSNNQHILFCTLKQVHIWIALSLVMYKHIESAVRS